MTNEKVKTNKILNTENGNFIDESFSKFTQSDDNQKRIILNRVIARYIYDFVNSDDIKFIEVYGERGSGKLANISFISQYCYRRRKFLT